MIADPADCSLQFDPVGRNRFDARSCDIVKAYLARAAVSYQNVAAPAGSLARLRIGDTEIAAVDPRLVSGAARADAIAGFQAQAKAWHAVSEEAYYATRG